MHRLGVSSCQDEILLNHNHNLMLDSLHLQSGIQLKYVMHWQSIRVNLRSHPHTAGREVHRSERREFARSERRLFTRSDRLHVTDFVTLARVRAKT